MIKQIIIVAVVVQLVSSCSQLSDCRCGKVCVQKNADKRCEEGNKKCKCKRGCMVFDIFVPVDKTESTFVYGNYCSCSGEGEIAACTKAAWRDQPKDVPVYESNPNCVGY